MELELYLLKNEDYDKDVCIKGKFYDMVDYIEICNKDHIRALFDYLNNVYNKYKDECKIPFNLYNNDKLNIYIDNNDIIIEIKYDKLFKGKNVSKIIQKSLLDEELKSIILYIGNIINSDSDGDGDYVLLEIEDYYLCIGTAHLVFYFK